MFIIDCPHCGPRPESEFTYGGDARVKRPAEDEGSAEDWFDHIYVRDNAMGWNLEWWHHVSGCRRWIAVERSNVTHEVGASHLPGESA